MDFTTKLKHHFKEVLKLKTSPNAIAWGFALGTLIAVLPTLGFGIFIGLLLIVIFKNLSKIGMITAFVFWNPIMLIPMYYLSYEVGSILFGELPVIFFGIPFFDSVVNYSRRFLIGNSIVAASAALVSYIAVYLLVVLFKKLKH